jgi:hypothetical protein
MAVPTREGALPRGGSVPPVQDRLPAHSSPVGARSLRIRHDSTLRHPSARSLVGGDHPVATFLGDLIQARARSSHPAGWPGTQAPARRAVAACQRGKGLLPCCLCTNMWITCAQRRRACAYAVEMLGIPLPVPPPDRNFTWENASRTLCMQRKTELSTCHAAIDNK